MSTNKFITVLNGIKTLVTGISTSAGVGDANKLIATNSTGKLDTTLLPAGLGVSTITVVASEAISAGDFVNLFNNTGTLTVRKADNSNGREANGFTLAAISNAASGTVYLSGQNTSLTGLTVGTNYYLGVSGGVTTTAPTTANAIIQVLGKTISATNLTFEYDEPVIIQ